MNDDDNYCAADNNNGFTRTGPAQLITVHAFDWVIDDSQKRDHVGIRAWCLDTESKPYCLHVDDFPAWCYVELPNNINGRRHTWDKGKATDLFNTYGISYVLGIDGKVDDIIGSFIKGELKGGESSCDHGAGEGCGSQNSNCSH